MGLSEREMFFGRFLLEAGKSAVQALDEKLFAVVGEWLTESDKKAILEIVMRSFEKMDAVEFPQGVDVSTSQRITDALANGRNVGVAQRQEFQSESIDVFMRAVMNFADVKISYLRETLDDRRRTD
jgi:hypothetical protein